MTTSATTVLDVREIPPREPHPQIPEPNAGLASGESMELVNDHDPTPLRHRFEAEPPGTFTWTYLEEGPEALRVRIGRV